MPSEAVPIIAFTKDYVPSSSRLGKLTYPQFHVMRNALVTTCRRFGSVGPLGAISLTAGSATWTQRQVASWDFNSCPWELGDDQPAYFIVDDMLNHDRYCYMEILRRDALSRAWMEAVLEMLLAHRDWGIGITNITDSYLLLFADKVMVKGKLVGCRTLDDVVTQAQMLLDV